MASAFSLLPRLACYLSFRASVAAPVPGRNRDEESLFRFGCIDRWVPHSSLIVRGAPRIQPRREPTGTRVLT